MKHTAVGQINLGNSTQPQFEKLHHAQEEKARSILVVLYNTKTHSKHKYFDEF